MFLLVLHGYEITNHYLLQSISMHALSREHRDWANYMCLDSRPTESPVQNEARFMKINASL